MDSSPSYFARVGRLLRRWDPRGLGVSDARAAAAVATLKSPQSATPSELVDAQWVCNAAVHPVLEQPIPSAFRLCSFMPVTGAITLGMISTTSPLATVWFHWLYQSHSAATRYCNYADTTRPLDATRMLGAYAASTLAACGIAVGFGSFARSRPRLRLAAMAVPHCAVACAGAISSVANAEVELREGVPVADANGVERGVSREAARATVGRAVLLHSFLIPSCALLLPVVAMRGIAVRLLDPVMLPPAAIALTAAGVGVVTPAVAASVPPSIVLPARDLEPEFRAMAAEESGGPPLELTVANRVLY